jgi:mannose-6-phosphate isomerase-like protein (cupin superfamily)
LVLSGAGHATVEEETGELTPGTLLLIEAGETHEVASHGDAPLKTLNLYAPPAY